MRVELQLQGQSRPKCKTQKDLCFRSIPAAEIEKPVFPLYFHPHKFFCAQVPGVGLEETYLFDSIDKSNEDVRLFIIDILSYVREYTSAIEILRTQVIPPTKDEFPVLSKDYLASLDSVQNALMTYLAGLEAVLKAPTQPDFISNCVRAVTSWREVKQALGVYQEQLTKVDGVAKDLSIKLSPEYNDVLYGKTIYQIMTSVSTWCQEIGDMAKGLAKTLPKVDYKKEIMMLLAFSQHADNATEAIN